MDQERVRNFIIEHNAMMQRKAQLKHPLLPGFLGVGAGRCGTSSIFDYVSNHPQIYVSPVKEINYFGFRSAYGKRQTGMSFAEYQTFFLGAKPGQVIGEISPIYLGQQTAAQEIAAVLPKVKVIITIRNPMDRFLSHFSFHRAQHGCSNFEEYVHRALDDYRAGISAEYDWFRPVKNIHQSLYAKGIARYLQLFGRDQVKTVIFDDLTDDPETTLADLCRFLGIDYLDRKLQKRNASKTEGGTHSAARLGELKALFAEDIERTARLIGRDLSAWAPR